MAIKSFEDGSMLVFSHGKIDDYRVDVVYPNGSGYAPRDFMYFSILLNFAKNKNYGYKRVYNDFVKVYNLSGYDRTRDNIDMGALYQITILSKTYNPADQLLADRTFTILYMAMLAEERKANTRLGRRIKRLGVHTLLVEKKDVKYSTTWMIGKHYEELNRLCQERGF